METSEMTAKETAANDDNKYHQNENTTDHDVLTVDLQENNSRTYRRYATTANDSSNLQSSYVCADIASSLQSDEISTNNLVKDNSSRDGNLLCEESLVNSEISNSIQTTAQPETALTITNLPAKTNRKRKKDKKTKRGAVVVVKREFQSKCTRLLLDMRLVLASRTIVTPQVFVDLVWEAKESVPYELLTLEDAHLKEIKDAKELNEIVMALRDVVTAGAEAAVSEDGTPVKIDKAVMLNDLHLLRLAVAVQLMRCSQLQKRFLGLAIVKEVMDCVHPKVTDFVTRRTTYLRSLNKDSNRQVAAVNSVQVLPPFQCSLTPAELDRWMLDSNILYTLLGESLHQDLVDRSDVVLAYMAQRHLLTESHIDLLWAACSRGAHEAVVRVLHQLIILLLPLLEPHLRSHLFGLVAAVPTKDYTEQLVLLLRPFTVQTLKANREDQEKLDKQNTSRPVSTATGTTNASSISAMISQGSSGQLKGLSDPNAIKVAARKGLVVNAPQRQWLGFSVLWQFILAAGSSNEGVSEDLVQLAIAQLVALLEEEFRDERESVMLRCVDNVQNGASVAVSLQILRRVLSLYPTASGNWFQGILAKPSAARTPTVGVQIEKLIRHSALLEVVFEDLERFRVNSVSNGASSTASAVNNRSGECSSPVGGSSALREKRAFNATLLRNNVSERLEFLKFIVSHSSVKLSEKQTVTIWRTFAEEGASQDTVDRLCSWLDTLICRDSKALSTLLTSLASETDAIDSSQTTKLALLVSKSSRAAFDPESGIESSSAAASTVFEADAVLQLFSQCVVQWASRPDAADALSRPAVAVLCMKMFLFVNIENKAIRVEPDAPWFRAAQLVGLPLIWRIAVDCTNQEVALAAVTVLCELHHRIPSRLKVSEQFKSSFLRQCFKQLYCSIQMLHGGDDAPREAPSSPLPGQQEVTSESVMSTAGAGVGADLAPGSAKVKSSQSDHWFDSGDALMSSEVVAQRIARLVAVLRLFVRRFYASPLRLCTVNIVAGKEDNPVTSITMRSTDTVGHLRAKVAAHLQEPVTTMLLGRLLRNSLGGSTSGTDKLEKDNVSLAALKFGALETITVSRKTAQLATSNAGPAPSTARTAVLDSAATPPGQDFDILKPQDLQRDRYLTSVDPLRWMEQSGSSSTVASDSQHKLFTLLPFEHALRRQQREQDDGRVATSELSKGEDDETELGDQQLLRLVRHLPVYVDQLLEMLDGYLSTQNHSGLTTQEEDLTAAVWDVLQALPTQTVLVKQVRDMIVEGNNVSMAQLLDASCPYRLLYTLQVLESLLSGGLQEMHSKTSSGSANQQWATKFAYLGGADHIVALLTAQLNAISESALVSSLHSVDSCATVAPSTTRSDMALVTSALLSRILHLLLLLDPAYSDWQTLRGVAGLKADAQVPSGVVFSCVDVSRLVDLLTTSCSSAAARQQNGSVSSSATKTFLNNGLMLAFGLVVSVDDGAQLLSITGSSLSTWLATLCVESTSDQVRAIVCWRVFECCAGLHSKVSDTHVAEDARKLRVDTLNTFNRAVMECARTAERSEGQHFEQLYTLLAGLETLSSCPQMIFPTETVDQSSAVPVAAIAEVESIGSSAELARWAADKFMSHRASETFHSVVPDGNLVGLLRLLLVMASGSAKQRQLLGSTISSVEGSQSAGSNLIRYLYTQCLFPPTQATAGASSDGGVAQSPQSFAMAVCQTAESRQLAFALLCQLCGGEPQNLSLLSAAMNVEADHTPNTEVASLHPSSQSSFSQRMRWNYDPKLLAKERGSEVGLSNQGGTCYMNAFLQQMYHIPAFRDGLLRIASPDSADSENDRLLFQLQVMFGCMRLSQKRYYDTLPFCRAFIDYNGEPVDLSEQKDINEFAGMLFEKLEHNSDSKALLERTIQGTVVWKTRAVDTNYRSEREETFYMVSAEVKEKATLEDSLELNVADELFSGDNRVEDDQGRKVDALRRCAIRTLPPTLIVHLKRFEFDVATMNRKKVNDFLSFPQLLDMYPYTEAGLAAREDQTQNASDSVAGEELHETSESESLGLQLQDPSARDNATSEIAKKEDHGDSSCMYVLRGVVAHVGAIDRGHYYSFITQSDSVWQEYNDRNVLPFSAQAIPRECFGGVPGAGAGNAGNNSPSPTASARPRENSAYILVYERVNKPAAQEAVSTPTSPKAPSSIEKTSTSTSTGAPTAADEIIEAIAAVPSKLTSETQQSLAVAAIAPKVVAAVWSENTEFQRDLFLFDKEHVHFMWQLLQCGAVDQLLSRSEQDHSSMNDALPGLVVASLRFLLDVLVRARAGACVSLYFERLADIVLRDATGRSAEAILSELTRLPVCSPEDAFSAPNKSKYQAEREAAESLCHPWLLQMFAQCPHSDSMSAFAQFLLKCVKAAGVLQQSLYLSDASSDKPATTVRTTDTVKTTIDVNVIPEVPATKPREDSCSVAKLLSQMLVLVEKVLVEDVGRADGYRVVSSLLLQVAHIGAAECALLVSQGAVYRVVCSVLSANPSSNNVADAHVKPSIELVAHLMKCSQISSDGSVIGALTLVDVQAFLNRVYLSDAIPICTSETSAAMQQVCVQLGAQESLKTLEFLSDKVLDLSSGGTGGSTSRNYRPYFKVLSETLLGGASQHIVEFESVVEKLVKKAHALSSRPSSSDAELIYVVCKLLHRIGTASILGHAVIMKHREAWKDIAKRTAGSKARRL